MALLGTVFKAGLVGIISLTVYLQFQPSTVRFENHVVIAAEMPTVYKVFADPQLLLSLHGLKMDISDVSETLEEGHIVQRYTVLEAVPMIYGYNLTVIYNVTSVLSRDDIISNVSGSSILSNVRGRVRYRFIKVPSHGRIDTHVQDVGEFVVPRIFHQLTLKTGSAAHHTLLNNVKNYIENRSDEDLHI